MELDLGLVLKYLKEELDSNGKEILTINFTGESLEKLLKQNK